MRRTAIVTGASRGLGSALARALAADGWNLVVDARGAADLARATDHIAAAGPGSVEAIPGDIADPRHVAALVDAAESAGPLTLLVNNAGTLGPSPLPPLASVRPEDLAATLATNVVAPLGLIQAALPALRRHGGTIVDVTSDAAVDGYEGWGAYGASKAAFEQLSRVLAAEEPTVRVFWVDPGDMNTRMHQDAFPGEDISDRPDPSTRAPAIVRLVAERPPSGRYRVDDLLAARPTGASGPAAELQEARS
ncbi:MAG TPA: SDR family oxidoreductase [Acidimicrobiales bacterium]|nr:SDR family oxidoreductase [Acidimicrobiales bacterium]